MIERRDIVGAIIAGGQGSRMGGLNKPLQTLAGKPLIRHVYERFEPQVSTIMVNANRDLHQIALCLPAGTHIRPDDKANDGAGPLAGLQAALAHAKEQNYDYIATVAADTPFFPVNLVDDLRKQVDPGAIGIARQDGFFHPLFGLWPTAVLADLEDFLRAAQTFKVMAFAKRHALIEVDFGGKGDPFFNINTSDELTAAEQSLSKAKP